MDAFTGNRNFKAQPRIITQAAGAYYTSHDGRKIFDGLSGLWCCGLGHGRQEITDAAQRQLATLDYSPAFQFGHPLSFELANKIKALTPAGLDYVFFTGSGSEAADTSLKMARAYWRAKGQAGKTCFIGREKGYHGVNFGGISVGGIAGNRKTFGAGAEADHLPHTLLAGNAFRAACRNRGGAGGRAQPHHRAARRLNDRRGDRRTLLRLRRVIVPPVGYLQRLREICTQHDILLIFDEVITAFGRCGAMTGAEAFGVTPDIMNIAKQVTNGAQPMGAVVVRPEIYHTFMNGGEPDYQLEFPHGYTYSAHPVSCAVALATLDILQREQMVERVQALAPYFERAVHSLQGAKHVADIRNIGLAAGITLAARPGEPARRPFEAAMRCWESGFYVRYGGDTLQLAPPFISSEAQIDALINAVGDALNATE